MMKRPLVLVPGLLCTKRLWAAQLDALADIAEITVATHDKDDAIAAIARRTLAEAPERFALAGLSMGGYVAFEMWRQAPHRIERLALLDTRMGLDGPEETRRRRDLLALVERGEFTGVHERMMPLFIHPGRLGDDALVDAIRQMALEIGREGFVRQTRAILGRADCRPTCPTITVPTLVLCGRDDRLTPLSMHEEMAALIPGARLAVIERCGHLSTMERPEAVNRELRCWLAG